MFVIILHDIIGRFPFDQNFQFEISGIPYDEWNGILLNQPVPGHHVPSFERKYEQ